MQNALEGKTELNRAGLLLLLGQTGDQASQTISVLEGNVNQKEPLQKLAAAIAIAQLRRTPLPPGAHQVILKEFVTRNYETCFVGLPWDVPGEINDSDLLACLDSLDREKIADQLIDRIETSKAPPHEVDILLELLFPTSNLERTPKLKPSDLSSQQLRAVRAMYTAMKEGKRIFYGFFPCWGLPHSIEEWHALAYGRKTSRWKLL